MAKLGFYLDTRRATEEKKYPLKISVSHTGYRAVYCYKYFPQRKSGFRLSKQDYVRQHKEISPL